jgi:hypothetical protein
MLCGLSASPSQAATSAGVQSGYIAGLTSRKDLQPTDHYHHQQIESARAERATTGHLIHSHLPWRVSRTAFCDFRGHSSIFGGCIGWRPAEIFSSKTKPTRDATSNIAPAQPRSATQRFLGAGA